MKSIKIRSASKYRTKVQGGALKHPGRESGKCRWAGRSEKWFRFSGRGLDTPTESFCVGGKKEKAGRRETKGKEKGIEFKSEGVGTCARI